MAKHSLTQSCVSKNETEELAYLIHKMKSLLCIFRTHLLDMLGEVSLIKDQDIEALIFFVDAIHEIATHERSEFIGEQSSPSCSH